MAYQPIEIPARSQNGVNRNQSRSKSLIGRLFSFSTQSKSNKQIQLLVSVPIQGDHDPSFKVNLRLSCGKITGQAKSELFSTRVP